MPEHIRHLREQTGKSRAQVASDLDISERHLQRLEAGDSPISRRWVIVFATYYGVPPESLEHEVAA